MWPFRKKTRQRRLEVRRNIPSGGVPFWRRLRRAGGVGSALLVAGFYLCVVLLDVWPPDPMPYALGQYIPDDIRARVEFRAPSEELPSGADASRAGTRPAEPHPRAQVLVRASRREVGGAEKIVELRQQDLDLLRAEHRAFQAQQRREHPWRLWQRVAGRMAILALITLGTCAYVVRYMDRIVRNRWRALALAAAVVLMLALTRVMVWTLGWSAYSAILPLLLAVIIIAIAYDQRFALAIGGITALLMVFQLRADLGVLMVLMSGMAAGVFLLGEIRTRSKLIQVSAVTAGVVFAAVWTRAMAMAVPWKFALLDSLWGAGFAMLTGFLAQGILPLIERVFRIATSMTLLEWCDASKPLLKRLSMEAPGTFNHSLQLGAMCEGAAEAIGAAGLRARAGAYYHDIGKINKPEYFVENQDSRQSKHEKLSPAMSLLIILGHVKDGIELAREYGLPRTLYEFVETHHGTTLVQYFYHAATEQRKPGQERVPEEFEFRYPGPKPRSKEAAILMLADAAESAVRAMPEPAPSRIEGKVHEMVTRRLTDEQLDECDLTLREVHLIETSLVKSLCGTYHARIAYPSPPPQKAPAPAEPAPAAEAPADSGSGPGAATG